MRYLSSERHHKKDERHEEVLSEGRRAVDVQCSVLEMMSESFNGDRGNKYRQEQQIGKLMEAMENIKDFRTYLSAGIKLVTMTSECQVARGDPLRLPWWQWNK